MIIERNCTVFIDRVADSEVTITVQEGVRVTLLDKASSGERKITIIAERNSTVRYEGLYVGEKVHTHITSVARGPHADIQIRIGSITRDNQQHIIKTEQLHEAPSAISHCEVRSICYDQSRSTYEGMIIITKDGQKTEAHQQHKALLIDEHARAFARPSLEVLVDDVQCGHGSAVGQLDPEQLFYLQTRGIALADAKVQLARSFMQGIYTNVSLKKAVETYLVTNSE